MTKSVELSFELPPLPTTATQLVGELNSADVDVPKVIQLVECEPFVASKVIQLANSPLYGATRPITTIGHSIVVLGFNSVAQLALSLATGKLFESADETCNKAMRTLFSRSLAVATVSRQLCKHERNGLADEAFLTGVMHDVGKAVLLSAVDWSQHKFDEEHPLLKCGFDAAGEESMFETTHPQVGKACAQNWGLPATLSRAIGNHHAPLDGVDDLASAALIRAQFLAREWGIGFDEEASAQEPCPSCAVGEEQEQLKTECIEQYEAVCEICL